MSKYHCDLLHGNWVSTATCGSDKPKNYLELDATYM